MCLKNLEEIHNEIVEFSDMIKERFNGHKIVYNMPGGKCIGTLIYQSNDDTVNHSSWINTGGSIFPGHSHESYEIIVVKKGTMKLILEKDIPEKITLKEGDKVYIEPGLFHRTEKFDGDCEYETITVPGAEGFPGVSRK